MVHVDAGMKGDLLVQIRPPTGWAWFASAVSLIGCGELLFELRKPGIAKIGNTLMTDAELLPWVFALAGVALLAVTWLVSLYLWPGRLEVAVESRTLRRTTRQAVRHKTTAAPFNAWHAQVDFFSAAEQQRRVFKRLVLRGPDWHEVLLYGDVAQPDTLLDWLAAHADELASYTVRFDQGGAPQGRDP